MSQIVNDRPPVTYHKKTFFQRLALDFRQNKMVYLMWLPVLAFYLIFHYAPMGGLVIAFQNYKPFKGIAKSKFVGLEHFQEFLTGTYAWRTIRNTLVISLLQILIGFPMPIIFPQLFNAPRGTLIADQRRAGEARPRGKAGSERRKACFHPGGSGFHLPRELTHQPSLPV